MLKKKESTSTSIIISPVLYHLNLLIRIPKSAIRNECSDA